MLPSAVEFRWSDGVRAGQLVELEWVATDHVVVPVAVSPRAAEPAPAFLPALDSTAARRAGAACSRAGGIVDVPVSTLVVAAAAGGLFVALQLSFQSLGDGVDARHAAARRALEALPGG